MSREAMVRRALAAGPGWLTLVAAIVVFLAGSEQWLGLDTLDVTTGAAVCAVLALTVMLPLWPALAATAALGAVWLAGWWAFEHGPEKLDVGVPTQDAVGSAAFFGQPYLDQQLVGAALIVLVLAGGAGLVLWLRRRSAAATGSGPETSVRDESATEGGEPAHESGRRRAALIVVGGWALLTLSLMPDLESILIDQSDTPLLPGWDYANLITWSWLLQQGQVPMDDFWYPYGGLWLLDDYPLGPVVRFAYLGYLLGLTAWVLWRLIGPRPARILLCLFAIVGLSLFDSSALIGPPIFLRYYPGLLLPLVYAAVQPLVHRRPTAGHAVLVLASAVTAFMSTDMFIVGLGGVAFVVASQLIFDPPRGAWRSTLSAGALDALTLLLGVAVVLLVWLATGTFEDNTRWYGALTGVSASSSSPDNVGPLVGLDPDPSLATMLLVLPLLLIVGGYAHRQARADPLARVSSTILFAAAGATSIVLAKHLVRPQSVIVLMIPFAALTWSAVLMWRPRIRSAVAAGTAVGALVAMLQVTAVNTPGDYVGDAVSAPVRAVENIGLAFDRDRVRAAGSRRFADSRFEGIPEKEAIAEPFAAALGGPGERRFATLGDAQILYPLFSQLPPDHITLYDAARVSEQKEMLEVLRAEPRQRLLWRRDLTIDGVPYHVRDPLVFRYAIDTYVPETTSEPIDVLRRRRAGEAVDWKYWLGRLGPTLDLGYIPGYSKAADHSGCESGDDCVPYAMVSGRAETGQRIGLKMRGRTAEFTVSFAAQSDVEEYAIRLDRLWFWPDVTRRDPARWAVPPGFKVQIVRKQAGDDLY